MGQRRRIPLIGIALGVLLVFGAMGLGAGNRTEAALTTFNLVLKGENEVPPVTSGFGSAMGSFTFDDSTRVLTYTIDVMGIAGDQVTASHIHRGSASVAGPVIYPLSGAGVTHITGKVTLTAADVVDLMAGNLYVNVHSITNPSGFARAQLDLSAGGAPADASVVDGVTKTLNAIATAWNKGDAKTTLSYWTDAGVMASFGASRADAEQFLPDFIGSNPLAFRSITDITSTGSNYAQLKVELSVGQGVQLSRLHMVLINGTWKIDNEEYLDTPVPPGIKAVELKAQEFAFVFDKAAVADGKIAFRFNNVGKQEHEVILSKIDPGINVLQLLQSSDPDSGTPPGVHDVTQYGPISPGQQANVVLTQPLSNGHYALLCFVSDTDGVPHALKGMVAEFDVTSGAPSTGSTVRPPNTGDAGLLDAQSQGAISAGMLAMGILTMVAGAAGLKLAAKKA